MELRLITQKCNKETTAKVLKSTLEKYLAQKKTVKEEAQQKQKKTWNIEKRKFCEKSSYINNYTKYEELKQAD